MSVSKLTNSMC